MWLKNWAWHTHLKFKIEKGVAGISYELHPQNFQNQYNFLRCWNVINMIFWYFCSVLILKNSQWVIRLCIQWFMACQTLPLFTLIFTAELLKQATIQKLLAWKSYFLSNSTLCEQCPSIFFLPSLSWPFADFSLTPEVALVSEWPKRKL